MGQNKISVVGKIMLVPGANMAGLAKRFEQKGFILRNMPLYGESPAIIIERREFVSQGKSARINFSELAGEG